MIGDWKTAPMQRPPMGFACWIRVLYRGLAVGGLCLLGLTTVAILRLVEAPLYRNHRPWTPYVTQAVCKSALWVMGLRLSVQGKPMQGKGAVVSNHSSWLDIFVLNSAQRIYFVSKSEVEGWFFIGWLAKATGTVFIKRKSTEARLQRVTFEERLRFGHKLLFFPEGTSTDSQRVLPFKSTLFEAFYTHGLDHVLSIQPVSLAYFAPTGQDPRFYGWWGDQTLAPHLLMTLAARPQGRVQLTFHPPVAVDAFANRKELAAYCESAVRSAHPEGNL